MEKLYSSEDLGNELNISKQAVTKAAREGRIEQPKYIIGRFKGWTKEQVERIKNSR